MSDGENRRQTATRRNRFPLTFQQFAFIVLGTWRLCKVFIRIFKAVPLQTQTI
jgi:hypothetical protein